MSYYENAPWPPAGQATWEHQTPPPARSGASSTIPREEASAFAYQIEEVDRAIENLVKSGKMFGPLPGGRFRMGGSVGPGARPGPLSDYGDSRGPHPGSNLQNFYASQRHQPSRGSNEAEQVLQAKRRMAAQRERELRNYHQEQQYNRTALTDLSYSTKNDRTISPGSMSEDERRELIARQRSALYGEGAFAEQPGYVDETGAARPGIPGSGPQNGPGALGGHSPMIYEYGRKPPTQSQPPVDGPHGPTAGPNEASRANSNTSPQSNPPSNRAMLETPAVRDPNRTSTSSPGGSPPHNAPGAPGSKPNQNAVAPIGTRPSVSSSSNNPALNKRSTTPLPSPLSQGYNASTEEKANPATSSPANNPSPATAEGPNVGLSGWPRSGGVWGNKSGLGVQASVWG